MTSRPNSLQAVLAREAAVAEAAPEPEAAPVVVQASREPKASKAKPKAPRPSRDGRRFLGGHFEPHVVRQMRMLAAEEDTTVQALLEEAVDLLFVRKGRGKVIRP